jgi:hypothetical protein
MSEVTQYVALLVTADDGVAAGEEIDCFNPNAAVTGAEVLARKPATWGGGLQRTGDPASDDFGGRGGHPNLRRSAR